MDSISLDLTYLNKLAGDDINFKLRVLNKLITQTTDLINKLKEGYSNEEWNDLAKFLHKLAGSIGNVASVTVKNKILHVEYLVLKGVQGAELLEPINNVYAICNILIVKLKEEEKITSSRK